MAAGGRQISRVERESRPTTTENGAIECAHYCPTTFERLEAMRGEGVERGRRKDEVVWGRQRRW